MNPVIKKFMAAITDWFNWRERVLIGKTCVRMWLISSELAFLDKVGETWITPLEQESDNVKMPPPSGEPCANLTSWNPYVSCGYHILDPRCVLCCARRYRLSLQSNYHLLQFTTVVTCSHLHRAAA